MSFEHNGKAIYMWAAHRLAEPLPWRCDRCGAPPDTATLVVWYRGEYAVVVDRDNLIGTILQCYDQTPHEVICESCVSEEEAQGHRPL
jgi:hypothetical protein